MWLIIQITRIPLGTFAIIISFGAVTKGPPENNSDPDINMYLQNINYAKAINWRWREKVSVVAS